MVAFFTSVRSLLAVGGRVPWFWPLELAWTSAATESWPCRILAERHQRHQASCDGEFHRDPLFLLTITTWQTLV